jgi:CheY-like chemotaxis protein
VVSIDAWESTIGAAIVKSNQHRRLGQCVSEVSTVNPVLAQTLELEAVPMLMQNVESSEKPTSVSRLDRAKTILIADDSEVVRGIVREALQRETDFEVTEATDGVEAVSKAKKHTPDLAILDVRMPRLSGIEAATILKRSIPKIRIVLISMYDDDVAAKLAYRIHIDASISKSDGITKLIDSVKKLMAD